MGDILETSRLIPEQHKVQQVNNVHQSLYQSISVSLSGSGEHDAREQNYQIGPPVSSESEVPEVIIEGDHGLSDSTR